MKFIITKRFLIGKIEDKGRVNLYTLLDTDDFSKLVAVGVKSEKTIAERSVVEVGINIRTQTERFELVNGEKKFVEVASVFIASIQQVGEK